MKHGLTLIPGAAHEIRERVGSGNWATLGLKDAIPKIGWYEKSQARQLRGKFV